MLCPEELALELEKMEEVGEEGRDSGSLNEGVNWELEMLGGGVEEEARCCCKTGGSDFANNFIYQTKALRNMGRSMFSVGIPASTCPFALGEWLRCLGPPVGRAGYVVSRMS